MHPQFAELTPRWFKRAFVYTGSIGDFRYRFDMGKEKGILHTAVYSVYCFAYRSTFSYRAAAPRKIRGQLPHQITNPAASSGS